MVLAVSIVSGPPDHWRSQIFWGSLVIMAGLAHAFARRIHWLVGALFFWAALSGLYCSTYPISPFNKYGPEIRPFFDATTSGALSFLLCLTLPFLLTKRRHLEALALGFGLLFWLESAWVLWSWFHFGTPIGTMRNPALDATLIAVTLPAAAAGPARPEHPALRAVPVLLGFVVILTTKASTGLLGLGVAGLTWALATYGVWLLGPVLIAVGCLGGLAFNPRIWSTGLGGELLNPNGRIDIWRIAMTFWLREINPWTGAGLGTFYLYGPHIQHALDPGTGSRPFINHFLWMHNEPLQVLFELGLPALALVFSIFLIALARSSDRPWLLSAIATYGACAFTQMPARHFLLAFYGVLIVTLALRPPRRESHVQR